MGQECVSEPTGPAQEPAGEASRGEYRSNVMVLYQDPPALTWAREVCDRVKALVGADAIRATWWKLNDLNSPAVLAGAVSTALRADVIVISVHATEALPLPVYVWVESWLPHRPKAAGALMALIAMPPRPAQRFEHVREYLRAVARQGHLDFLVEERKLAAAPAAPATKSSPQTPALARTASDRAGVLA